MAEILSALAGHFAAARHGVVEGLAGVTLEEIKGRDLVQVGAWPETVASVAGELAAAIGSPAPVPRGGAVSSGRVTVFFVGPDKIWVTAPLADGLSAKLGTLWPSSKAVVTELGHSRTVIRIGGANARDLIARFLSLDTDPALFAAGGVASAGLHGIGVTLHHAADGRYDLYVPRTFALSVTEALVEVAEQWGCEVEG
jgi:sarcosine oxidase subunit gamma